MNAWSLYGTIFLAALLGGGSAGLLGFFVVGLRMPFLAVFAAHAAMAGAILGPHVGIPATPAAFLGALGGAMLLWTLVRRRTVDLNVALGFLFSLMLGLAFLGIGLSEGAKSETLGFLWGSLLFVTRRDVFAMALVAAAFGGFAWALRHELKALLFSREMAGLVLPEDRILAALLLFGAAVATVNLEAVGGMMLYALLANPAMGALAVSRRYSTALWLSAALGAASALGGFAVAWAAGRWGGLSLPTGACIVLVSCLPALGGLAVARRRSLEGARNDDA